MPDVHVIYPLPGEARRDLLSLLFQVKDYGQELLNVRRRNIVAIGPLDEGLALEVEYCNQACHRERRGLFTISLSTSFGSSERCAELKQYSFSPKADSSDSTVSVCENWKGR